MYLNIFGKSCTHPKNTCAAWVPPGVDQGTEILLFSQSVTLTYSAIRVHLIVSFPNPSCISAVTVNSSTTSYHLTRLKAKTMYRVQISGFTNAGEGPRTLSQPFSTPKYGTVAALCISVNPASVLPLCTMYDIILYPFLLFEE